jgi:methylthioribose-1-phosphate isomerase
MLSSLTSRELFLCARGARPGANISYMVGNTTQNLHNVSLEQTAVPAPVEWAPGGPVRLVDQTLLPRQLTYIECRSIDALAEAILTLRVRGAPAIGIAAAYGLCLAADLSTATGTPDFVLDLEEAAVVLRSTRPTAVNLAWALDRVLDAARLASASGVDEAREAVYTAARAIDADNSEANVRMGEYGAALLRDGMNVLTHCNAGPLAAGGIGSALGIIYTTRAQGKSVHVWVDETRPLLQGARLTAWELTRWGVPCTLIADNMAASLMADGRVDAVITGADRIAANGDAANKIGTYGLAVLARAHSVPFYMVAPVSTLDLSLPDGRAITIEERKATEITHHGGVLLAPEGVAVYNPAFDVTPSGLISAIITESGVARPPYTESLLRAHQAAYARSEAARTESQSIEGSAAL